MLTSTAIGLFVSYAYGSLAVLWLLEKALSSIEDVELN
jgi:hypothetical protein